MKMRLLDVCRAGAAAAMLFAAPVAAAAATADIDAAPAPKPLADQLETVHIVHNWVLCVSQPSAETMARAQELGTEAAEKAYQDLAHAKTCGRFSKFGVLLHKQLYPAAGIAQPTRVFAASVNIGVGWMDAFVVSGEELASE